MTARLDSPAIQALIFDMDGLLVDSEHLGYVTVLALLERHGCVREWDPEFVASMVGRRVTEVMAVLVEICELSAPVAELSSDFEASRIEAMRGNLVTFPGSADLLAFAATAGLGLGLATSGRRGYVDAVLAEIGLTGRFAVEVTGDDVARGKPAPDVYLLVAERLGVAPGACVVFEDAPNGIAAAVAAGMRAVAIPNIYTREATFAVAPEMVLPDLHAAIPWLHAQGIA